LEKTEEKLTYFCDRPRVLSLGFTPDTSPLVRFFGKNKGGGIWSGMDFTSKTLRKSKFRSSGIRENSRK